MITYLSLKSQSNLGNICRPTHTPCPFILNDVKIGHWVSPSSLVLLFTNHPLTAPDDSFNQLGPNLFSLLNTLCHFSSAATSALLNDPQWICGEGPKTPHKSGISIKRLSKPRRDFLELSDFSLGAEWWESPRRTAVPAFAFSRHWRLLETEYPLCGVQVQPHAFDIWARIDSVSPLLGV